VYLYYKYSKLIMADFRFAVIGFYCALCFELAHDSSIEMSGLSFSIFRYAICYGFLSR
jgi:hypothetical protein